MRGMLCTLEDLVGVSRMSTFRDLSEIARTEMLRLLSFTNFRRWFGRSNREPKWCYNGFASDPACLVWQSSLSDSKYNVVYLKHGNEKLCIKGKSSIDYIDGAWLGSSDAPTMFSGSCTIWLQFVSVSAKHFCCSVMFFANKPRRFYANETSIVISFFLCSCRINLLLKTSYIFPTKDIILK